MNWLYDWPNGPSFLVMANRVLKMHCASRKLYQIK
jgi:hypothetical protein